MSALDLVPPVQQGLGRRERQRRAMLAEILQVSLDIMAEEGVAGLNLAEVARRIGVKPPSLYKHVESKHAVYDALFAAGTRQLRAAVETAVEGLEPGLDQLAVGFEASVRWCIEHPVLTQLLFWRTVPGFEPSPASFKPSIEMNERSREVLQAAVDQGQLHPRAATDAGMALFTCLASGVITQQLANEPDAGFHDGRFTRHTREAFDLFVDHFSVGARARAPQGETPADGGGTP